MVLFVEGILLSILSLIYFSIIPLYISHGFGIMFPIFCFIGLIFDLERIHSDNNNFENNILKFYLNFFDIFLTIIFFLNLKEENILLKYLVISGFIIIEYIYKIAYDHN